MEHFFTCPYCWEEISFIIDITEPAQNYIEDCEVCCNPISIKFQITDGAITLFEAEKAQ